MRPRAFYGVCVLALPGVVACNIALADHHAALWWYALLGAALAVGSLLVAD